MLPLTPAEVMSLREDHGIYMAGSGRFNVVGLSLPLVRQMVMSISAAAAD